MDRRRSVRWTHETLCPVWSATKGAAGWCLLQALRDQGWPVGKPLDEIWPQLVAARNGKGGVTIADVLHHRIGLPALDAAVDGLDHEAVRRALEIQRPEWVPGTDQGYHPRTFGWLLEELVRRVSGAASLGEFWDQRLRQRFDVDFWIGLPVSEHGRVAEVVPGKWTPQHAKDPLYSRMNDPASLQARAFRSPVVASRVSDITRPEILRAGLGAFGGVATAAALARFYAVLAGIGTSDSTGQTAEMAGFSDGLPESASEEDRVLLRPLAFRGGFMAGMESGGRGGHGVFGHGPGRFGYPGAGGVLAFADPLAGLGFAYVMNQMELQVLPGSKARRLVAAFDQVVSKAVDDAGSAVW